MSKTRNSAAKADKQKYCGIVMPISAIDGCDEKHWFEVKSILSDAIEDSGFKPNLVSDADDAGVIHKRIVKNLYDYDMIVCDVSCKNPNVMFELGLRLAFDKPTIIVKDDNTGYSFDTSAIEHIEYPRDLRFSAIVEFKETLKDKINATHRAASENENYTTFLKHFGEFKTVSIESTEVSATEYLLDEVKSIKSMLHRLSSYDRDNIRKLMKSVRMMLSKREYPYLDSDIVARAVRKVPEIMSWGIDTGDDGLVLTLGLGRGRTWKEIEPELLDELSIPF